MNIKEILGQHKEWLATRHGARADLNGAILRGADLCCADLSDANLRRADLSDAFLSGANLRRADLRDADLRSADLRSADLTHADLRDADLRSADLTHADMRGTNLSGADMRGADMRGAILSGANLRNITGNAKQIKSLHCAEYLIAYTNEVLQIGCENHPIKDWWEFTDEEIIKMDGKSALLFWRKWKPVLQTVIATEY